MVALIIVILLCSMGQLIYSIPLCPIPIDKRFPVSMHVYGESMCPNGCCNWTFDGCCQGNNGIPQEKLDAVESIDWMFITGDIATDMKEQNRHGHDHIRRKRQVDIVEEDGPEEDEEKTNDGNEEQNGENRYVAGFRILGIIVVFVGLLNLAYPDHLRV